MQFFYGNEPDMFTFFKIPKLLFSEPYKGISTDAKLLFGLMLDRMSLSAKGEHWIDHDGRVFIYFPIQDVMELLNIADNRATKLYKELESVELIERKRQGLGKPTKIYVCKFFKESQKSRIKNRENHESRIVAETNQESLKSRLLPITETESNKTESNETENIIPPNPPKGGAGEADSDFDRFWVEYPRKQGKGAARNAYRKARKKITAEEMLSAVRRQKKSWDWTKEGGRYVPQPATWLNQERWSDELRDSPPPKDKDEELPSAGFKIL